MLISELIKELQERLEMYGDAQVVYREFDGDMDLDICSAYFDQDEEKMVVSDMFDPVG